MIPCISVTYVRNFFLKAKCWYGYMIIAMAFNGQGVDNFFFHIRHTSSALEVASLGYVSMGFCAL